MKWGLQAGTWGLNASWGVESGPGEDQFCEIADTRVLVQMDDATSNRKFRDFICDLVGPLGHYADVGEDVSEGFDLDTAIGAQLDKIGEVVGLARQGFADDRYRTLLEIQIDLLLSTQREDGNWTGTGQNIIDIARKFIGTTVDPVVLQNFPPYDFTLTVPSLTLADAPHLFSFLCKAIYAGVLGQVIFTLASDSLWASTAVVVTGGGIYCSASVAVAGCATWGTVQTIGTCQ